MDITKACEKLSLTTAPQRVGRDATIPFQKALNVPEVIQNAHTIAASRRLAPLKKNIFEELECQTILKRPFLPLPKIQPNPTKSNLKFPTLIHQNPPPSRRMSIFNHRRPINLVPLIMGIHWNGLVSYIIATLFNGSPFPFYVRVSGTPIRISFALPASWRGKTGKIAG